MEIRHRLLRTLLIFILSAIRLSAQTPPVVPAWAFKHIVWEDNMNTREGAELLLKGYKDHSIPVEAIIIDSPWSTSYNNFNWDEEKYPDPSGMLSEFAGNDIRVILWLTGAVNIKCKDTKNDKAETYDYVVEKGYGINGSQPHEIKVQPPLICFQALDSLPTLQPQPCPACPPHHTHPFCLA